MRAAADRTLSWAANGRRIVIAATICRRDSTMDAFREFARFNQNALINKHTLLIWEPGVWEDGANAASFR